MRYILSLVALIAYLNLSHTTPDHSREDFKTPDNKEAPRETLSDNVRYQSQVSLQDTAFLP
ncbi:hypothetical protein [Chitinivibrio alkaliphilus]|uniref:Uncharacterized protein n=1 Tax=Chitinivibrio alkaliphilus ACht1 TaxID=1313304 RepID=U7DE92_9BACT|nr:hypothetical protein [Chitinivibrio alkaliphilus]ERP39241.1 hypothetical protein CALK_0028 [Chitinivibrio alkaliphilus ACht1]